ncbi:NAD(P)H-dependent oxidoreductase [Natronohydrobacter thiooxidans]|uniref:NAD(P)H-dependent oxidoreductase n=1 Tax=Natronohydrobacter thiooxidans TaxID=87172 RepID=UPI0008FF47E7|nr:NAD(P)H-dependent oxidoreductase [Natronohydrobacter thiooxidans]
MADKTVLIVVAHPEPKSFTHAMACAAAEALIASGHSVQVSDLYNEGFRPDIGRHDMTSVADADRFQVQSEQAHAARVGAFAKDIAREQARIVDADNLILQFPLWWGAPPAILKGWIDRVLAYGFGYVDGRRFDTGVFKGRRAMIGVTTGGSVERFSDDGVYGPIGPILMPVRRLTLEYMGYDVAPDYVAHGVPRSDDTARKAHLAAFAKAVVAMAALPVVRTDDWRTALDTTPDAAWNRPI